MIHYFEKLNDKQVELLLKAPILVTILIAGADGTIDNKEIKEAISFAEKQTKSKTTLVEYFKEVSQDFEDKFKIMIQSYPFDPTQRTKIIIEELTELNALMPLLDVDFSIQFYNILKSIAQHIATSSGGLLGINTVADEEARYVDLYMITDPRSTHQQ